MRFSGRLEAFNAGGQAGGTLTNALGRLLGDKRRAGHAILDLTVSNPTTVGIPYPEAEILAALAPREALAYAPDPRGLRSARAAVAADSSDPDDVLLTASTSDAYAYLVKLLCDPGDVVLAPEPSYPLFSMLAALEGVVLEPYHLRYDGAWHIDFDSVTLASRPRAILVVSPGNPTGACLEADELARLSGYGIPLIVDEVFAGYRRDAGAGFAQAFVPAARPESPVLTFSLGGLSKSAGLPQLKLGWIIAGGRDRAAALERLELIADTYLSVATPVQLAAARLIELGAGVRTAIRARVRHNRDHLAARLPPELTLLAAQAGWSAIVRFPDIESDEELALRLLRERSVLVQPGYFYDLTGGTFIVLSLLGEPDLFAAGVAAILSS